MFKYIAINYFRQYARLIKKNITKCILGFILALLLVFISIDFIKLVAQKNTELIYISLFAYSILKLFQDIPVVNFSYQLIEFKLLKLWQLKLYIFVKCIYSSLIVLNLIYLFPDLINEMDLTRLSILILMNINSKWIYIIAFITIIYICDSFLNILNSSEAINKNNGFYFPYKIKNILIQKYIAHLIIIFIPFICSIFIIKHIKLPQLIICFLLIPIRNIFYNFLNKNQAKYTTIMLNIIILLCCLSGVRY